MQVGWQSDGGNSQRFFTEGLQKLLTKNKNWEDAGGMRNKGTKQTTKWQVFAKFSYQARQ